MALILADRVKESTTTTGTSDFALGGAVTGFQSFATAVGANNTTYYAIADGADWEVGLGTLSSDGLTLVRTTVYQSSNSDTKVSFASGTKQIFVTYAADKAVFEDASGNVTLPANLTVTGGSTTDSVQLDLTAGVTPAVGQIAWDAAQGTATLGLLGGNVLSRLGQTLVAYVTNAESTTITKGQAVYLFGAQGDRATVKLANNTGDATSAKTLGIVAEDITANGTGFVVCQGVVYGLDLSAYTAGDTIYLGSTAGTLTATKPYAPNHLVYLGVVEKANAGAGQLYVRVQNGYELDELHNVSAQSPTTGQTIVYNESTSLWEKNTVSLTVGVNGTLPPANGGTGITSLGSGVATFLGTPSSANLAAAVTDETGTGALVFANSPTLVTPALGTPSSATLTNATGLPISTGVSGLGTGIATALAVNVGTSGAPVINGGALGTPSSGTVTNLTGTASININGTVGASTPNTGAFTTVTTTGTINLLTVGRGAGDVATNTAVGASALATNSTGANIVAIGANASTLSTGSNITAVGYNALSSNTTGAENHAFGTRALQANTTGGENTAIGRSSMVTNTTGNFNVAVGKQSLQNNTTASNNTAVGYQALLTNTTGYENVAVGSGALYTNANGYGNVSVGRNSLYVNSSGALNSAFGDVALRFNTTGNFNVAVGSNSLYSNTTSSQNTAVGYQAAYTQTTAANTTAVGYNALYAITTGSNNTAVGVQSGRFTTTGIENVAVGLNSFYTNTTGSLNVALGKDALFYNTTASNNTAVGYQSGYSNTTGAPNTFLGYQTGFWNTTGVHNTAVGNQAYAQSNTATGSYNTAVGSLALVANTSASENTAVGYYSLNANTTGAYNVAVGKGAAQNTTTANGNTAVGTIALNANTTGAANVAMGFGSLQNNTTASNNVAVGYQAGYANTTGGANVAMGYRALYANTNGQLNVAIGYGALTAQNVDAYNTAVGANCLESNTSGSNNVGVGRLALNANTLSSSQTAVGYEAFKSLTGEYNGGNTALGNNAGSNKVSGYNCVYVGYLATGANGNTNDEIVIGVNKVGKGSNTAFISANGGSTYNGANTTTWATTSDERIKKNIVNVTNGLSIITALRPVEFDYKENDKHEVGFIAQEYAQVLPDQIIQHDASPAEMEWVGEDKVNAIQQNLVPYLVKAIQELKAEFDAYKATHP